MRVFSVTLPIELPVAGAGAGFEPATSGLQVHRWLQNTFLSKRFLSALSTELSGSYMKSGPVPPLSALCVPDGTGPVFPDIALSSVPVPYPRFVFVGYAVRNCLPRRFTVLWTAPAALSGFMRRRFRAVRSRSEIQFSTSVRQSVQNSVINFGTLPIDPRPEILYNEPGILAHHTGSGQPLFLSIGGESVPALPPPSKEEDYTAKPASHRGSCFGVPPL